MSWYNPSTWNFAKKQPAVEKAPAQPQDVIVSIERPQFGVYGEGFARVNLDNLAGKKGLAIYAKMRLDEQVKAVCSFKRDAIVSRGWTFEWDDDVTLSESEKETRVKVYEKVVAEMGIGFVDALNVISTGREYGYSITEKVYGQVECDGKTYTSVSDLLGRDPETFEFFTDPFGQLKKVEQEAAGRRIPIDLAKFVHYVHNPEFDRYFGRSDLREAYRSWYFKDRMVSYWGTYMERLGGGLIKATIETDSTITPGTNAYTALQNALSEAKATAALLLPKGVEAEIIFPQSSDAFEKACTWHDLAIARSLLVPNLMGISHTGQTGAFAQSQTQLETFAWTLQADAKRLESCIDRQVFRDLGDQNWGDKKYPKFKFKPLSTEQLKWIIETLIKLAGAGAIIVTEDDEKRLREILEMPPRDPKAKPLLDPEMVTGREDMDKKAQDAHDRSEEAKDNQVKRGMDEDRARATDPVLKDVEKKKPAFLNIKQGGKVVKMTVEEAREWLRKAVKLHAGHMDGSVPTSDASQEELMEQIEAALSALDMPGKKAGKAKSSHTITRDQARINIASVRERVDFAVIDKRQTEMSDSLAYDLASLVAKGVKKELGTDEQVAALTDEDTQDIGLWQLPPTAIGRLRATTQKALSDSWVMGQEHARREMRKSSKVVSIHKDIRNNAAAYFESNAFKVAGDVSDRARSIIQQELLTSVKVGRSPAQTRTAIWERLVAKGLSSREAVRAVETEESVIGALNELWKDTEEAAIAYLNTVARTNLFSAMNEARYAEFTDPALGDFVVALRYSAVLDDRTTQICEGLHDHVYLADNPIWDEYRPPNHFNCRSVLIPVTQIDIEDGLWNGQESEDPKVEPQEGFGS